MGREVRTRVRQVYAVPPTTGSRLEVRELEVKEPRVRGINS